MNGSSTSVSGAKPSKIWRSEANVTIPAADILSFAFANLGQYDVDKPIFVDANDPSSNFSAREAQDTVRRLVKGFKEHGVEEGDVVCLVASNNIWYGPIYLAVIGAGGCVYGLNPAFTSSELTHHFTIASPKYVITQSECLQAVKEAASACNISPTCIFLLCSSNQSVPQTQRHFSTIHDLLEHGECDWETDTIHYKSIEDKVAALSCTSGTTGLPKAAVIPHRYAVAQASMIEQRFQDKPYQPSQLVCLPVFHAFAAQLALVLPLRLGIATYLLPRFSLRDFSRIVKTFQITDTAVVPPIVTSLLRLPNDEWRSLETLRYVLCAGAPIAATVQSRLYQLLPPGAVVGQVWGTTELGWVSMFNWNEKDTSGSVGRLLPGVQLRLAGGNGTLIHEDLVHGEAHVQSPSMFVRYQHDSDATATAFDKEGFCRTGDRVYLHDDKIFIDGRVKDTMKIKGWQVSPTEIEGVLLQHPMITDAAVVGISALDDDGLEISLPRAYVVLRTSGSTNTHAGRIEQFPASCPLSHTKPLRPQEVIDFAASKLVSYKKLTGGVVFVNEIPRNATGKILRRLLHEAREPESSAYRSEASRPRRY